VDCSFLLSGLVGGVVYVLLPQPRAASSEEPGVEELSPSGA
jgi:uncharacterized membrane protein